jgi:hypothetical protein
MVSRAECQLENAVQVVELGLIRRQWDRADTFAGGGQGGGVGDGRVARVGGEEAEVVAGVEDPDGGGPEGVAVGVRGLEPRRRDIRPSRVGHRQAEPLVSTLDVVERSR